MSNLIIRTEDIKPEHILDMYVESPKDNAIIDSIKAINPAIIEGSRGTGKSFLLRVAEAQLLKSFHNTKILPVYIAFGKSSLLQTKDPNQFVHWMMARMCSRIIRALYQMGLLVGPSAALSTLLGGNQIIDIGQTKLEAIAKEYEESYKKPHTDIDFSNIPTVEDFRDSIEDICKEKGIDRICILFDEAAHIFRPEQQRQFFTLFRDLRSPYISCNAAVYPGVTFYGTTFQANHDGAIISLSRNPLDSDYLTQMRDIVLKQADSVLIENIERHSDNFNALAYSVSGNPRLLLKIVVLAYSMKANDVKKVLKEFYRTDIWAEHSILADKYVGHRAIIDWGRQFMESRVIVDTNEKNSQRLEDNKNESTCYFVIHRDSPKVVFEAIRMLSYTGIVTQLDSGVVITRGKTGTRYAINLGCIACQSAEPIVELNRISRQLSIKRFSEYGENHSVYQGLLSSVGEFTEGDLSEALNREMTKSISVLDLSNYQKKGLIEIGIDTIADALHATEADFQRIKYVGPTRSRQIMNVVFSSILEYLSG
jgi:hypothetical protein